MQTQRILAGVLPMLSLAVTMAFAAPGQSVPDAKLSPIVESGVPFARWTTEGGGQSAPETSGFTQAGRGTLTARLSLPVNADYRVSGEVLLPATGASVGVQAGAAPLATEEKQEDKTKKTPPLPMVSLSLSRQKDGLELGRAKLPGAEEADPRATWLPFSVERLAGTLRVTLAGAEQTGTVPDAGTITLNLRGGAQVRNVAASTSAPLPDRMVPLHLDSAANISLAAPGAGAATELQINAASLARGVQLLEGTPFLIDRSSEIRAIDVKPSLSGWRDDQYRSVKTYLRAGVAQRGKVASPELNRVLLDVPANLYSAVHLLAFSRDDEKTVPRLTLRYGFTGSAAGIYADQVVQVPAWSGSGDGTNVVAGVPVKMANGKSGFLYHLRVPLPQSANLSGLDKDSFQIELTRDLKIRVPVPDPFEFGELPVGLPSGAVVVAATMERTPVELEYSTAEYGNVFNDTQRVVFQTRLTNDSDKSVVGRVFINAGGPGTAQETALPQKSWSVEAKYSLQPGESKTVPLDVTPDKRGWFKASVGVEADGVLVQQRDTSFAVLAPDTRRAMDDSPFGVWSFWDAHSAIRSDENRVDYLGSLID
jgi:hypothetical protein